MVCFCQVGILHISASHYLIAHVAVSLTSTSHFTTGHYDWWYFEFLCFAECLLSVSLDKRPAGSLPSDLHPSAVYMWTPSTSQANLTFKAPTHTYWTAVLSPVQIWTRESCREGRVEKRYPGLWLLGGAQKRIPHSWANLHSHGTSPVHYPLFYALFSLLIHSLFL